ncbi:MAG: ferredoxin [Paracoccaceae bacterium]
MDSAPELHARLRAHHLEVTASLDPDPAFCPAQARALVLISPTGGDGFWPHLTTQPEWRDGAPDPLDRWSHRVLSGLARDGGGVTFFPSDGPPWPPFQRWATESGALWQSPVGMLVHARMGLWTSFRGALAVPFDVPMPPSENPCTRCADRPCVTACPVAALSPTRYDTDACHAHLDKPEGADCLSTGCRARRACPVSQSHARSPEQSAYHMSRFHR